MNEQHYLGFRQFAGNRQRYITEWRGQWANLAGGGVPVRLRNEWCGWHGAVQIAQLHLIVKDTRLLILTAGVGVPILDSEEAHVLPSPTLGQMVHREESSSCRH